MATNKKPRGFRAFDALARKLVRVLKTQADRREAKRKKRGKWKMRPVIGQLGDCWFDESCISVPNKTPIQIRQFGKIGRTRPYPEQILWEDGSADTIALTQVDSVDFITYKSGQPLEAVVARDPVTFQLLRILYIRRRSTDTRLPAQEEAELLNAIGSAKTLPSADWA